MLAWFGVWWDTTKPTIDQVACIGTKHDTNGGYQVACGKDMNINLQESNLENSFSRLNILFC